MNFLTKYLAQRQIKKLASLPRNKQFIKLGEAKSIGLLFDATDKEHFELIKKFIARLKEFTKNVHAIGFVDEKITPNYSYIKTDIDLFNKKELQQGFKPQSPYIKTFINEEKDILIDINLSAKLPLRYIAAASKAKCKAGIHSPENESIQDVLINTGMEKGDEFYFQQLVKYLS